MISSNRFAISDSVRSSFAAIAVSVRARGIAAARSTIASGSSAAACIASVRRSLAEAQRFEAQPPQLPTFMQGLFHVLEAVPLAQS